jgi:trehalose-6-phosphate synthase
LQFNPWNVDEFAGAIYQALKMSKAERAHRWKQLWEWVSVNTASRWSEVFLKTLGVLNK